MTYCTYLGMMERLCLLGTAVGSAKQSTQKTVFSAITNAQNHACYIYVACMGGYSPPLSPALSNALRSVRSPEGRLAGLCVTQASISILRGLKDSYEAHHGVRIQVTDQLIN